MMTLGEKTSLSANSHFGLSQFIHQSMDKERGGYDY